LRITNRLLAVLLAFKMLIIPFS